VFFLYLLLNGIERFFIEKIRVNNKFDLLGMQVTQAEVIATLLMLGGAVGLILVSRQKNESNGTVTGSM
jgi:phosphatidylglycerol:prolipoprotein diacylglycerol transferase